MNSGPKRRRKPDIAGHHQDETAGPADLREVASQRLAPWFAVMAQDHPGQAAWQPRRRGPRVGDTAGVGEQPKLGQARASARPSSGGPRPGDKSRVHNRGAVAWPSRPVKLGSTPIMTMSWIAGNW